MAPALKEGLQYTPAPSKFAHLKNTEPSTTASGVIPGQAAFDTPPPDRSPSPELVRSQQSRRPTTKKQEGSQAVSSKSKSKSTKTTNGNGNHTNTGSSSHSGTSKPSTNSGSQARDTVVANENTTYDGDPDSGSDKGGDDSDNGDDSVSQRIIDHLEAFVGHSVAHLSNRRIKELLDSLPQTQASALETQAEPSQAIAKLPAGVGLAGGDRDKSPPHEECETPPQLKGQRAAHPVLPQRRHINTLDPTPTTSKRVRITTAGQDDGSAAEDEDEDESEFEIRVRRRSRLVDLSESESGSDTEPAPPHPTPSQSKTKPANPKIATPSSSKSSGRPMHLPSLNATPSTNTNSAHKTSERRSSATSHPTNQLPPVDLNDIDAVVAWALKISEERVQALNQGPALSKPSTSRAAQRPDLPSASATADHISQAIAKHWSRLNGSERPGTQENDRRAPQSTHASTTASRASTPEEDRPASSGGQKKRRYSKKAKLGDFPSRIGEVASAAIPRFLATVFAEGSYESPEILRSWAGDASRETWDLEAPEDEYEPPPKAVLTIMMRRASWLRTKVKERIQVIVQYGFGSQNPAVQRCDIKYNRRLAEKLGPHVFHCKNLKPNTDQYEHPEFIRAIGAGLFWDPESIGAVYHTKFNPVPIPAVALMQVCIEEWALGQFKSQALDVEKQQLVYERHLLGLYEYERIVGGRLTRFRENWFKTGVEYSRANLDNDDAVQPYTQACHVRPDTPPAEADDEEPEGEGDDD
ncbi:hypothetical protein FRC08_008867 [Ceratobasidium sp. 394]|nr:hypothetical protein FRC08_008867 [Ceratobasidium sp. 394]